MNRKLPFSPLFLLVIVAFLSACNGGSKVDPPEWGRSNLHIVNVSETGGTFDLIFDYFNATTNVITSMEYQRNWPIEGYADLQEAGEPAEDGSGLLYIMGFTQVPLGGTPDTIYGPKTTRLNEDEFATMCFYDSSGQMSTVKFTDVYATPADSDSVAVVRFINLKEDVTSAGMRNAGATLDIPNISWRSASDFRTWTSGTYMVEVYDTGTGSAIYTSSMEFEMGKVYTFVLSGTSSADVTWYKH